MTPRPPLPSGSTITSAKLLVPAGTFDQDSGGDTLSPMQFGFLGLLPAFFFSSILPSLKAVEVSEHEFLISGVLVAHPPMHSAAAQPANRRFLILLFTNMVIPPLENGSVTLFSRRQFLGGDLRLDALRLGGVEVQLDLDAVRVVHEKLVERLAVRAPLAEFDLVAAQVQQGLPQALRAKRDVVDRARARACVLREAPEVGLLVVARVLRALADVDHVHAVEVHPVDGKTEVR